MGSDDPKPLGKYMTVECVPCDPHDVFTVRNKRSDAILAFVEWYAPWRCYVAQFEGNAVMSADCLRDVAGLLESLKHKGGA